MKKILIIILAVSLLIIAGCAKQEDTVPQLKEATSEPTTDSAQAIDIENIAINFTNDIVLGRYLEAYENYSYSEQMKSAVSLDFYKNDIGAIQDTYGDFIEMKTPFSLQKDSYTIISIPIVFENKKINYNVVFNKEGEIAGFNFQEYKEGESPVITDNDISLEEISKSYVLDLMEGNYENAYSAYPHDAAMTDAVNPEAYKNMIEELLDSNGTFVNIGESYSFDVDVYIAVDVPIVMEKENINLEIYYDKQNKIAGIKFVPYQEKPVTKEMPEGIIEQELTASINGYELGGTLTLPKEGDTFPCVVLVHGSGPNDRDETILSNKPFRDIAWELAQRGIAVYRYDKRTYTYPKEFIGGYALTIYDETIDDAVEIIKMLLNTDNINPDEIYVLGHSLGGYAMPRIAENTEEAAGYILMAGSIRAPHELIPLQYEYLLGLDGDISDEDQATLDAIDTETQKILNIDDYDETQAFMGMYKAYIQDLLSYDPIDIASSIKKPVLVLQGERDYQVTMIDYNMWYNAFIESDNWTFNLYPKLNHLMMPGEGVPSNADYSVSGSVDESVIKDIASFINK